MVHKKLPEAKILPDNSAACRTIRRFRHILTYRLSR
jgi:hypothetical protein